MSNTEKKDIEYYMGLDWTLIEGTDLDFEGHEYHYIEIKEIYILSRLLIEKSCFFYVLKIKNLTL